MNDNEITTENLKSAINKLTNKIMTGEADEGDFETLRIYLDLQKELRAIEGLEGNAPDLRGER